MDPAVCPGSYRAILNKWISQPAASSQTLRTRWLSDSMAKCFTVCFPQRTLISIAWPVRYHWSSTVDDVTWYEVIVDLHWGQETASGVHFRLESWWGQGPLWIKCPLTTQTHFAKGNWGTQWDVFSDVTHIHWHTIAIFDTAWSLGLIEETLREHADPLSIVSKMPPAGIHYTQWSAISCIYCQSCRWYALDFGRGGVT